MIALPIGQDFEGNDLRIGDEVVYYCRRTASLERGVVGGFNKDGEIVHVKDTFDSYWNSAEEWLAEPGDPVDEDLVIKVGDSKIIQVIKQAEEDMDETDQPYIPPIPI